MPDLLDAMEWVKVRWEGRGVSFKLGNEDQISPSASIHKLSLLRQRD